jgi:hypothetical protein
MKYSRITWEKGWWRELGGVVDEIYPSGWGVWLSMSKAKLFYTLFPLHCHFTSKMPVTDGIK